ncbi:hypothetical protein SDJN03_23300, partial [Cucurbita argyrosperma subsp. sororia]
MNLRSRLFCCISLLLAFLASMSVAAISLGSSLKASDPDQAWISPGAIFSLRFVPSGLSSSSSSCIAGIVYFGKVFVIWSAGGGAPVDASGALHFQFDGNLASSMAPVPSFGNLTPLAVASPPLYSRTPAILYF